MSTLLPPLQQFQQCVKVNGKHIFLHQPVERKWTTFTWNEVDRQSRIIATGLKKQGLEVGDRVAILAKNCAEWYITDFAIAMAGLISVPIYATAGKETIEYVLEHSGTKFLVVGKLDSRKALESAHLKIPTLGLPYKDVVADESWRDWLTQYAPLEALHQPALEDMYTIVYTSGSTGKPKGVVLSGKNLANSAMAANRETDSSVTQRGLSYLPLAHITERVVGIMASLYGKAEIYFTESLETFAEDLRYCRPTIFISVPRLWVLMQQQILSNISQKKLDILLKIPLVKQLISKKLKRKMGFDACWVFVSGAAPIPVAVLEWYAKLDINIIEGWGLSETSAGACVQSAFGVNVKGSIGKPVPQVEMKLSANNEILIKGELVFSDYYNDPDNTAASFEEGWFKTGDLGRVDANGNWYIIGRAKEEFKTAKGKYVSPVPIECEFASNSIIEQMCLVGIGRTQPIILLHINAPEGHSREQMTSSVQTTLDAVNKNLESHQVISNVIIIKEPFSIDNDMLTPTLKIRRPQIEAYYNKMIDDLDLSSTIIWL